MLSVLLALSLLGSWAFADVAVGPMYAVFLGVPVMACDVSGPHGFLTEHGGTLLENSKEGLLNGMRLFAEGKVRTLRLDYEKMNRESAQMVEDMIAEMLDCTEKTEIQ